MKAITINVETDGAVAVHLDGVPMRVEDQNPASLKELAEIDATEDVSELRHDTPLDVQTAMICYSALRLFNATVGVDQKAWSEIRGIEQAMMIDSVRAIHLHEAKWPQDLHDRWMHQRLNDGWAYHPDVPNYVKMTHPMLVPFFQLPAVQKKRYRLFFVIANALLAVE